MKYLTNCDGDDFYAIYHCPICYQMGMIGRHETVIHEGAIDAATKAQMFFHRQCLNGNLSLIRKDLLCVLCRKERGVNLVRGIDERNKKEVLIALCDVHQAH